MTNTKSDDLRPAPEPPYTIESLLEVMARLRDPLGGCPWDRRQTFATIAPYTIEEAYEVADAIDRGNLADLSEELGDLLLQVVYHARIAEEVGAFSFGDVAAGIARKMIRRHPHVFGTAAERAAGATAGFWERIKAEERRAKAEQRARLGIAAPNEAGSLLDGVPRALPPLTEATKLQARAARAGFDWPALAPVLAKLREEVLELEGAVRDGEPDSIRAELGDLLFTAVNIARHLEVDPEVALRSTNSKFRRRFARIETLLGQHGKTTDEATLDDLDAFWEQAKAEERD